LENFDDLFARFDGFEDIGSHGLFLDGGDEVFSDSVFDVGFEQGEADFTKGVGDVFLGNFSNATEVAEGFV